MVTKLVKEDKRTAFTVPYVVRKLTPMEWAKLRDTPTEEAVKRRKKLDLKVKDPVPHDRYPCNLKSKGLGWCQVTIMKESADLKYRIFGMHIGLSVEVTSLRDDGQVQIWAQGEEYDATDMEMKLQPENEGWSFLLKETQVRDMIRNNRANWLKYNIAMVKDQEKEDQKLTKKKDGPCSSNTFTPNTGAHYSRQGTRQGTRQGDCQEEEGIAYFNAECKEGTQGEPSIRRRDVCQVEVNLFK